MLTVEPIYRIFLLYHLTSGDVQKRTVIRRIFGIREKTADLSQTKSCGRYIVVTLTNKADIIIVRYLGPYRLSTDSKTRDLE